MDLRSVSEQSQLGWADISAVGAITETTTAQLKAEPSQGSHFFHNITSLGISHLMATLKGGDFLDRHWLQSLSPADEIFHVAHLQPDAPMILKLDGKRSLGVILIDAPAAGGSHQNLL